MVDLQRVTFGYRRGERLFDRLDLALTPGNVYGCSAATVPARPRCCG